MAKRPARRPRREGAAPENLTIKNIYENLSAGLQRQVTGMRENFGEYASAFRAVWQKREELVGPFFALLNAIKQEYDCSFVEYAGLMDPTINVDQRDDITNADGTVTKGYRKHPTYQAALYMQRLQVQQRQEKRKADAEAARVAAGLPPTAPAARGTAINATTRLARVLKTMTQLIQPRQLEEFWSGMAAELDLDQDALLALRKKTEATEPILRVPENLRANQRIPVRILHLMRPGERVAEPAPATARGRRRAAA